MGKYDMCMKAYLHDKKRFADLFNGSCFQGKPVIRAEDLEEASEGYVVTETFFADSPEENSNPHRTKNEDVPVERKQNRKGTYDRKAEIFRDVKMRYRSGMILQVLAVENQSYIDYGMPVRCMGYDAAEYGRQLKERKQERKFFKKHKEESVISTDEKLSGILKSDRLHPVYTICLYSGDELWDGPRKLSDMMEFDPEDENLRTLFEEYHLHLFCINEQSEFDTFHSDLKQLFRAMNCRKNKEKMAELIKDETYSHLSEETWEAIAVMTDNAAILEKKDTYKTENGEREEFNMCQALEELMEEREIKGEVKGEIKGDLKKTKIVVRNMLDRGYEIEDICAIAECDSALVEEVRRS